MSRYLITFLLLCWQVTLARVLGLVPVFIFDPPWRYYAMLPLVLNVATLPLRAFLDWYGFGQWPSFWLWRLSRRVVGFCTMASDRVSLLFPAGLDEVLELQELIQWSEMDLDDLSQRFGIRLPRRLTIVLTSSHQDLTEDFGRLMGGTVLTHADAVLLAADYLLREGLRHELTHLFAVRWNRSALPLVQEGLAVWLQNTTPDQTNTAEDIDSVLPFDTDPLPMLDPGHFFAPDQVHASYALAGEFTGFLIRHFGWDHYRRFYGKAYRWRFRSSFRGHFGMSFEEAWRWCHDDHVEMARVKRMDRAERLFDPLL